MASESRFLSTITDAAICADAVPYDCPYALGENGRFVLQELIAMSDRSWVYRAFDQRLSDAGFDATVAVKIARRLSASSEALTGRRVEHEAVVRVLDRGTTPEGLPYLVMEWIAAGDLSRVPVPLAPRAATTMIARLASAVQAAHTAGVVHCDLKPDNVLVDAGGQVWLADFDLATLGTDDQRRGNLAFMAPEQFRGEAGWISPQADIYALGGLLFYVLTGRLPFGDREADIAAALADGRQVQTDGLEADLGAIVQRAMAPTRAGRYSTALELAEDLRRWMRFEPLPWRNASRARRLRLWTRRRPARAATLAAACVLAVAAIVWVIQWQRVKAEAEVRVVKESLRVATEQMEEFKAGQRDTIRMVTAMVMKARKSDQSDLLLPAFVWLEWLSDQSVLVYGEAQLLPSERRAAMLRAYIEGQTEDGSSEWLASIAGRWGLVEVLLREQEFDEAAKELITLESTTQRLLAANDPLKDAMQAAKLCCAIGVAKRQPTPEERDQLVAMRRSVLPHFGTAGIIRSIDRILKSSAASSTSGPAKGS